MTDDGRDAARARAEEALRVSLERNARNAPRADLLAEQVIRHAAGSPPRRAPFRWRTWALPVLAAGGVAAVVLGLAATGDLTRQANRPGNSPTVSHHVPNSGSSTPTPNPTSGTTTDHAVPVNTVGLHEFRAVDLTFVGANQGYALGTAKCVRKAGTCSAIVRTGDGVHWTDTTADGSGFDTPFNIESGSCQRRCVSHIRFATEDIGYVYGRSALFVTTDGGADWTRQAGGADALETLKNNVIRVVGQGGCPPGCAYAVQVAKLGSSAWTDVTLPPGGRGVFADLSRTGDDAFLLDGGNAAGGASARATLFESHDDGAHWSAHDDPCPRVAAGDEIVAQDLTTAGDGTVAVTCLDRMKLTSSVAVSTNRGASFVDHQLPGKMPQLVAAASSGRLLVNTDALYRSTDSGQSFHKVQDGPTSPSWIGFENATTGRAVTDGGRRIWTTTDAGAHWSSFTFG
ncbi:WD40/YVTN/BNR-like repeat-containing protein [uncultured Jatrophihabitans sp.]|uniref:WD40/YVTN/BNR-like repeat-containing protein n=1 Tax=uncultured Jatrophihabitans sp. TaxID=1610747 RepID=UPI0035CB029A